MKPVEIKFYRSANDYSHSKPWDYHKRLEEISSWLLESTRHWILVTFPDCEEIFDYTNLEVLTNNAQTYEKK